MIGHVSLANMYQFINQNDLLAVNIEDDANGFNWDDAIDDVLNQIIFWVVFYLVEKILVLYITVHYHYR